MSGHDGLIQRGRNAAAPTSHTAGNGADKGVREARDIKWGSTYQIGSWREEVVARSTRLKAEALWLQDSGLHSSPAPALLGSQVFKPLDQLNVVLEKSARLNVFLKLRNWYHGSEIEECWRLLRQAEEGLLIVDQQGVRSRAELALAHGMAKLGSADPLVRKLDQELKEMDDAGTHTASAKMALQRIAFDVLGRSHEASNAKHLQMRGFRNQLLMVSGLLLVLAVVLLLLQQFMISAPLVPSPGVDSGRPDIITLILIMFFGCIGALFSAVPSLSQIPENGYPFDLVRAQALLKCVIGMWSAVVGILVVKAGIDAPQADSSTLAGLFMVAGLFGAGQEAITRFADHKAAAIRASVSNS